MAEAQITINGNLTADPELRFTPSGVAVATFSVASTPRQYNRASGEWEDGETTFMRVNVWRQLAEGAAENLRRGDGVVVIGKVRQRSFETREGEKRTVYEIEADDVGKSVRVRGNGGGGSGGDGGQQWPSSGGDSSPF